MLSRTILHPKSHDLDYSNDEGWFFLWSKARDLFVGPLTCRDEFRWEWEGLNSDESRDEDCSDYSSHRLIGFSMGPQAPIDYARFAARWARLERMAGVERQSTIYRTDRVGTVILRLSPFWVQHKMHRSLVTLLIRMVAIYWTTGLNQALGDYELTAETKPAILRFLRGYTKPTFDRWNDEWLKWFEKSGGDWWAPHQPRIAKYGSIVGWVGEFATLTPGALKKKLVRP